jgi:beta-glucosidase-like glycosyl hydrolase/CubicO group peptidase (beta-lactamase class C family)
MERNDFAPLFRPFAAVLFLAGVLTPLFPLVSEELPPSSRRWVRATLEDMSLEEKAAQMIGVRAFGRYYHSRSPEVLELVGQVCDLEVGGVVVFASEVESLPRLLNRLQEEAEVPLLVAADMERGIGFRIVDGTVSLPYAMAIGATRSAEAARFAGRLTAREGRALGIHWTLSPVVDVNVNPGNPVIHVRSFGEDPELVASLAAAYVQGVHEGGLLATAKHFPGHGDTTVDSHLALPTIAAGRERLEAVELAPFRRLIAAGVDAVMSGHLAVPALDAPEVPATLSPAMIDGLLRREMGFDGLVVTDAMEMDGVGDTWAGAAAVRAVAAGADMVLLPPDPRVAVAALVRAVAEGELAEDVLDRSVTRILAAKARLGLHRRRLVDLDAVSREVAAPEDVERALEVARRSITVVKNDGGLLPLRADAPLRLLVLTLASDLRSPEIGDVPEDELEARRIEASRRLLGREVSPETADAIVAAAAESTHVVVLAFVRPGTLAPAQARLVERLVAVGRPVVLVSFGSPYLLAELPQVPVYVAAYGGAAASQRAAFGALFGEFPIRGKLPVTLPGLYPYGHGLEIPRYEMTLRSEPAAVFGEVDRILADFVERRAFPGGVVAVGRGDALVHLSAFGRQTYDPGSPAVTPETIYDVASLTKVVATTTMAMILVDEERLGLDAPVQSFLPRFEGRGKEAVTVRQLLSHSSGLDWWAPLYEEARGPEDYLQRVQAMELAYEPGTRSLYSDLGLILLGEVLERAAGEPLDAFARRRVLEPLGMTDTLFRPGADLLPRIAPTERDEWRGRLLHGEVHDENAFALGGVAPHAGLFSTAGDLARFARMIVAGGVFEHRRIVSRKTVEEFVRRAGVPDSTRALGWDTKSAEGSSAGTLFSPASFGHTGFTGTSLWIDPERELFVILLTNRVHPTRENNLIREARPAVADAVVRALERSGGSEGSDSSDGSDKSDVSDKSDGSDRSDESD